MKLEHVIHIGAPPEVVWDVTVDVERWPEWTPTMDAVVRLDQGAFDVGSKARVKQPGQPEATWVVTSLTRGERFTWESRSRGIQMIATHEIEAAEAGTKNLLRIEMSGLVATLLWPLIRTAVRRALEQENAGLKKQCESLANNP